ncbi:MAG: TM2 domain-containing protein [Candidatus Thermoplasmatota archaeon]|nr:TM2 domain-containing protein [Candidatus Thermoplasmatota archaeon]
MQPGSAPQQQTFTQPQNPNVQHQQYPNVQSQYDTTMGQIASPNPMVMQSHMMQKSKMAYLLLGIFVGWLGVHNFYIGHTSRGIAQLLITVLTIGILAFIPAIWAIIECIMLFTSQYPVDANGVLMRD